MNSVTSSQIHKVGFVAHISCCRRAAAIAAAIASTAELFNRKERGIIIDRTLFSFPVLVRVLRSAFIVRLYRMENSTFMYLVEKLGNLPSSKRLRSCGQLRMSITLPYLAYGSYLDIALCHQQSTSSICLHIGITMLAIDAALESEFPYDYEKWPSASSVGFPRNGRSPLVGCCADFDVIENCCYSGFSAPFTRLKGLKSPSGYK